MCCHERTRQQKDVNDNNVDRAGRLHKTTTIYDTELKNYAANYEANNHMSN
jgi:hypothetical protein